ncbi:flagellar basal body rod protein [Neobacillus sp. SM06]|uniref:lmo0954 family membrane protein n=1 Tax=Neobacillus sp. SM06 TaxID=3422492 RepID=UPI003D282358
MKKFGLLAAGSIAALVLLATLGPMIALTVSLVILYFIVKQFLKAKTVKARIGYGILGFIVLVASFHNVPAVFGAAAAYVLYLVYKKWNRNSRVKSEKHDPFVNFEKQWNDLKNS